MKTIFRIATHGVFFFLAAGLLHAGTVPPVTGTWVLSGQWVNRKGAFSALPANAKFNITLQRGNVFYGSFSATGQVTAPIVGVIENGTPIKIRMQNDTTVIEGTLGGYTGGVYRTIVFTGLNSNLWLKGTGSGTRTDTNGNVIVQWYKTTANSETLGTVAVTTDVVAMSGTATR